MATKREILGPLRSFTDGGDFASDIQFLDILTGKPTGEGLAAL